MEDPELEEPKRKRPDPGFSMFYKKADRVADTVGTRWILEAACAGEDPELWQPDMEQSAELRANTRKAVNICFNECPVRLQCLEAACVAKEPAGIWGGLGLTTRKGERSPRKPHDFEELSKLTNPYE